MSRRLGAGGFTCRAGSQRQAIGVTGDYDYLVKVAVADTTHYERFLREKLYRIQGIRHTRSTFSLRTLKLVMSADPLLVNAGV